MSRTFFEPLRRIAAASISASYSVFGSVTLHTIREICITNTTDGDMIVSTDNTVVEGEMFIPAGGFILLDVEANINPRVDDRYELPRLLQFYIKYYTAPSTGDVWLQTMV